MRFVLSKKDIPFESLVCDNIRVCDTFVMLTVAWDTIPIGIKKKGVMEALGIEMESPHDWYFSSIVLPLRDGLLSCEKAYFYINQFSPDEETLSEISKFMNDENTYLWANFFQLKLSMYEQVEVIAKFLPYMNMKKNI